MFSQHYFLVFQMYSMKQILFFLFLTYHYMLQSQQNVGIGTTTPNSSSILDISSSNKGLLIPRMDSAQRVNIVSPATGLLVYQTNGQNTGFYYYNGMMWVQLSDKPGQLEKITEASKTGWRLAGRNPDNYGNIGQDALDFSYSYTPSTSLGARGDYSVALGAGTTASGPVSTAMGSGSLASGLFSTSMGSNSAATGDYSTAMGQATKASGIFSFASGDFSEAIGPWSNATGRNTSALGASSSATGENTIASGIASASFGSLTKAVAMNSLALGRFNDTVAMSNPSLWIATDPILTIGNGTSFSNRSNAMTVYKNGTFDLQNHTTPPGNINNKFYVLNNEPYYSGQPLKGQLEKITEGPYTGWRLSGWNANYFGNIGQDALDLSISDQPSNILGATGYRSVAIGDRVRSSNDWSIGIGSDVHANGLRSIALGNSAVAQADNSIAMTGGIASGHQSVSIGNGAKSSGEGSISLGSSTMASGNRSFAAGNVSTAAGNYSTALGSFNKANSFASMAVGLFNDTIAGSNPELWIATDPLFMIGNGIATTIRSNAFTVYKNGTVAFQNLSNVPANFSGKFYVMDNEPYFSGYPLKSQLEKITEGSKTGWRLEGRNPDNYGDIGLGAVDFSFSGTGSTTRGATGDASFTMGIGTTASGISSTALGNSTIASGVASTSMGTSTKAGSLNSLAIGRFNDTITMSNSTDWVATDPLFMIGNGTSDTNRRNAMTIFKNGTLNLQNHNNVPENSSDKFYVLNNEPYFGGSGLKSQLEKITEGSNTGWRLAGQNPENYGNIGQGAVDLSFSNMLSTSHGAKGDYSTALGERTLASGSNSTAMGRETTASHFNSVAMGYLSEASGYTSIAMGEATTASGYSSTAMGLETTASGWGSTAMGRYTEAIGDYSTAMGYRTKAESYASVVLGRYNDTTTNYNRYAWFGNDPLFMIGNGTSNMNRSNAITVLKNGNTGFGISSPNHPIHHSSGAHLTSGGTWTNASSKVRKEDFIRLNGATILTKVLALPVTQWKYKGTNEYHIGPMAEDFYDTFKLGNDNAAISTVDVNGVALIAIQELAKENRELKKENKALQNKVDVLNLKFDRILQSMEERK